MKRWLAVAAASMVVLLGLGFLFRDALGFLAMRFALSPKHDFSEQAPPTAPDDSQDTAWGALPHLDDPTDTRPTNAHGAPLAEQVDLLFLQPTTYLSPESWNQPLDDDITNERTDGLVLRGQASAFNDCCRVHAPRYRQATFFSFMDESSNGQRALDLAFADVEAAFDSFLERIGGRPFMLAGHSQGSLHLERLLRERVSGTPLRDRLVAAYPMGYWFDAAELEAALPDIPVCSEASQTTCLVTWNSVRPRVQHFQDPSGQVCVNPLTWRTDGARAPHSANAGSLSLADEMVLEEGVADAQCIGGALLVQDIRSKMYEGMPPLLGRDNWHILDVHLFYDSVRANARQRAEAFLAQAAAEGVATADPGAATP